jgi:hypothetical protein
MQGFVAWQQRQILAAFNIYHRQSQGYLGPMKLVYSADGDPKVYDPWKMIAVIIQDFSSE